jgi:hypothetical protein
LKSAWVITVICRVLFPSQRKPRINPALIEAKAKGQKPSTVVHARLAPVVDEMAARKENLKPKAAPKKTLLRAVLDKIEKKSRKAS